MPVAKTVRPKNLKIATGDTVTYHGRRFAFSAGDTFTVTSTKRGSADLMGNQGQGFRYLVSCRDLKRVVTT